jgi:hypothetical protein
MKGEIMRAWCLSILLLVLVIASFAASSAIAQNAATEPAKTRIGVYDSRAVAIAWARAATTEKARAALVVEAKAAKAAGNQKRYDEIEQQMKESQFLVHAQGFSNVPPEEALAVLQPDLPAIAKKANVVAIAARLDQQDPSVEAVDVTDVLIELFAPTEQTRQIIASLRKQPPIRLWAATHAE